MERNYYVFIAILTVLFMPVSYARHGSLALVIDDTLSMRDEIGSVKEESHKFMDIILTPNNSQIRDIVIVTFNDPGKKSVRLSKSRSKAEVHSALDRIKVHDGFDCPEYSLTGIKAALEESQKNSYLFVFTDASPKEGYNYEKPSYRNGEWKFNLKKEQDEVSSVSKIAQSKGSQIFFFLTKSPDCNEPEKKYTAYWDIAKATNGQVFKINEDIDFQKFLDYLKIVISGEGNVIHRQDFLGNIKTRVSFTVDNQTEYVLITATTRGAKVELEITRKPTLNKLKVEWVAWTAESKVLKINNPPAGKYTATVQGSVFTSVMIAGRTDFTFQHGFSETIPRTFKDENTQPIDGKQYFLLVKVHDPTNSVDIKEAQITNKDGKKVPITLQLGKHGDGYYASEEKFTAPSTLFEVTVIGEGKRTGEIIKRTAKTPIEPVPPNMDPEVSIIGKHKYKYNSTVSLTCTVKAYPKPAAILWKDDKGNILKASRVVQKTRKEFEITVTINNFIHEATYYCYADMKKATIDLSVITPFTAYEDESQASISVALGDSVTRQCNITAEIPMKIEWYQLVGTDTKKIENSTEYSISEDRTQITIKQVNTESILICEASIKQDVMTKYQLHRIITIKHAAPVNGIPVNVQVKEKKSVNIKCNILKAFPKPEVTWKFKSFVSNKIRSLSAKGDILPIRDADVFSAGVYTCTAVNAAGSAKQDTTVTVLNFIEYDQDFGNFTYVDVTASSPKKELECKIGARKGRWYEYTYPMNKTDSMWVGVENNNRNYTCRVSDSTGSISHTYVVVAGFAPTFRIPKDETVNWDGKERDLSCSVSMSPERRTAEAKWYYNGKESHLGHGSTDQSQHPIVSWGNYTCNISNYHGFSVKHFKVYSSDCVINSEKKRSPLVIDSSSVMDPLRRWPSLQGHNIIVKHNMKVVLFCNNNITKHNKFEKLGNKFEVLATCDHEDKFKVDEKIYSLSDLQCEDEVTPTLEKTGQTCSYDNTEMIKVGYKLEHTFIEMYSVCFDKTMKRPVYTNTSVLAFGAHVARKSSAHAEKTDWQKVDEYFNKNIGDNCNADAACCITKGQLMNQLDMPKQRLAMTATFIDGLNSVSYWRGCDDNNDTWSDVQHEIRSRVRPPYTLISGASDYKISENGIIVPKYLWKILKKRKISSVVVMAVMANTSTKEGKLCSDACPFSSRVAYNNVYCCKLKEFQETFNVTIIDV